jgi:hypothetical protein
MEGDEGVVDAQLIGRIEVGVGVAHPALPG